jgi:hypothetical protein
MHAYIYIVYAIYILNETREALVLNVVSWIAMSVR